MEYIKCVDGRFMACRAWGEGRPLTGKNSAEPLWKYPSPPTEKGDGSVVAGPLWVAPRAAKQKACCSASLMSLMDDPGAGLVVCECMSLCMSIDHCTDQEIGRRID